MKMNIVEQLENFVQRQPFQPFTVHVAGGGKHRIEHPDFLGFSPRGRTIIIWTHRDTAIFVNPALVCEVAEHNGRKTGRGER